MKKRVVTPHRITTTHSREPERRRQKTGRTSTVVLTIVSIISVAAFVLGVLSVWPQVLEGMGESEQVLTVTPALEMTVMPTETMIPVVKLTPTPTSVSKVEPVRGILTGDVWMYDRSESDAQRLPAGLLKGTEVEILEIGEERIRVVYRSGGSVLEGWVNADYVEVLLDE